MKDKVIPAQNDPILEALRNVGIWLSRDDKVKLMVAAQTLEEFRQQELPPHVQTSVKKRTGQRTIVRGPRDSRIGFLIRAKWLEDNLIENALPSMACVIRGSADLQIGDYVVHCQTGDFIFYPPATPAADGTLPHFIKDHENRVCDLLWIFPGRLNGQGLQCSICHSRGDKHSPGPQYWVKNYLLSYLFQELFEEVYLPDNRESVLRLVSNIVFFLQQRILRGQATSPTSRSHPEDLVVPGRDAVEQALAYIDSHLSSNLTIDVVARHVCISPSVFKKKFKQQTGHTFNEFVTHMRMTKAAQLLHGTHLLVSEISGLIGVTDCQFRRLARDHWDCTPREFRERQK